MKKYPVTMALLLAIISALSVAGITAGCGLFDAAAEGIPVSITHEFDFDLNADQARDQLEQAITSQGVEIDLSGLDEVPLCVGQDCGVPVPTIEETFELELPAKDVDLSNQPQLKDALSTGSVSSIEIESISYDITQNSLNFNLPSLDLYMDDLHATQITGTSSKVAEVPGISAGEIGGGFVQFTSADEQQIMSDYMKGLKFTMLGVTTYTIDTSVTRTVPQGRLRGKIKIRVKFTFLPF